MKGIDPLLKSTFFLTRDQSKGGRFDADVELRILVDHGVRAGHQTHLEMTQKGQPELSLRIKIFS